MMEDKEVIAFELSMPGVGSWNGKWTQADKCFVRTMPERKVPKEYWDKDFFYSWDDGWTACVSVRRVSIPDAKKLDRESDGFAWYDWMIRSIIRHGRIETDSYWNRVARCEGED